MTVDVVVLIDRWGARVGLVLLAPLALFSHLAVAFTLAVKVWAEKMATAWRAA